MKQICALLLALLMLGTLSACSAEKQNGQILDSGWVMRGDEDNFGYGENGIRDLPRLTIKTPRSIGMPIPLPLLWWLVTVSCCLLVTLE